ncbi:MAG: dolichol kinase [Cyanobacteriota bacterium]|nr:dolichol kinase [Cyanobacteriota bacterium]
MIVLREVPPWLGPALVALWLSLLAVLAKVVQQRWPDQPEWSRKLVHIGSGPVVLLAWWFGIDRAIALPVAGLVTLVAALNHRLRLLPGIEDIDRHSYGTIAYGASITLLFGLLWPERSQAMTAGVLVMAFGDGLAGLVGPLVRSPRWQVFGQTRSLAGTAAMGVSSALVLLAIAALQPATAPPTWALLTIAAVATALEQWATAGVDNLTVPLVVAGLWWWLASSPSLLPA